MKKKKDLKKFGLLIIATALVSTQVNAIDWNTGSGNWTNAASWTPSGPPSSADIVYIGNYLHSPATCTVTSAGAECSRFILGGATGKTGTLEIISGSLTIQGSSPSIGYVDRGVVMQSGGILDISGFNLDMGNSTGGDGAYYLSGGELRGSSSITIGYTTNAKAIFNLSSNGIVRTSTQATYVGRLSGATGTVVQTGGTWDHNGQNLIIANQADTMGTYHFSDGIITNYNDLYVGNNGNATFEMSGGKIKGGTGIPLIGAAGVGSVGLLTQSGGIWDNNGTNFFIGNLSGSKGTYEISGGILTNVARMFNGNGGTGTFSIVGSAASIHMDNYTMNSLATLKVTPSNGALSVLNSDAIGLDGILEVDFENYDGGAGYPDTLLIIKYNGWGGVKDFAVTNILTPNWSADVEYDAIADEIKLINIAGPPKGMVLVVK